MGATYQPDSYRKPLQMKKQTSDATANEKVWRCLQHLVTWNDFKSKNSAFDWKISRPAPWRNKSHRLVLCWKATKFSNQTKQSHQLWILQETQRRGNALRCVQEQFMIVLEHYSPRLFSDILMNMNSVDATYKLLSGHKATSGLHGAVSCPCKV